MPRSALSGPPAWALAAASLLVAALPVWGQQAYVSRYDLFTGYTFLDSPRVGLFENGFHVQAGYRLRTWASLGVDYSVSAGDLTLTPNLLLPSLQQQLGAELGGLAAAGQIPPTYQLVVPAHSRTQTFAAGPQVASHHWQHVHAVRAAVHRRHPRGGHAAIPPIRSPRWSRTNWRPRGRRRTGPPSTASAAASTCCFPNTSPSALRRTWSTTTCSATC